MKRRKYDTKAIAEARERMWAEFGGRCGYCGFKLSRGQTVVPSLAVIDHIDGDLEPNRNVQENLMLCCHACNGSKNDQPLENFRIRCALRAMGAPSFTQPQWRWLERQGFFAFGMRHQFYFERVRRPALRVVA